MTEMGDDATWVGGLLRDVAEITRDEMPQEEMEAVAGSVFDLREKLEGLDMTRDQAMSAVGAFLGIILHRMGMKDGKEDDERDTT